jgi:hypothetical protein
VLAQHLKYIQSEDTNNAVITIDSQTTGGSGFRNTAIQFQENSTTQWMIGMNGVAGGSEEDKQFVIANNTSFDTDNILNINPSNGYVGIGVQAPTERLDIGGNIKISDTYANITTELSGTGVNTLTLSGVSSQLSELRVTSTNSELLSFGTRGSTEASFPTYGNNSDNYIYSNTNANGLNIISRDGIGTDDYIRFYAGQDADGTTPDIIILGSGATRGYVGIGTETPTEILDVSGNINVSNNTTVNNDLIVSGDTNVAGGILQTGVNLYGSSTLAIDLTNKSIVRFELDGTITGPSVGAGTAGQRIILYVETVTAAGTTTISVPGGLGFTQIVFSSLADSVEMIYDSGNWLLLSSQGATIT